MAASAAATSFAQLQEPQSPTAGGVAGRAFVTSEAAVVIPKNAVTKLAATTSPKSVYPFNVRIGDPPRSNEESFH
jgi:hypothetical protein